MSYLRRSRFASRRSLQLTQIVGVLLVVGFGAAGGCQGRSESSSKPALVLLDSSLAGNEALYDSSTANLAWDRLTCLEARARRVLGNDVVREVVLEAERTVRAKHSRIEHLAGERGIASFHDAPTEASCRRVDSLWYAQLAEASSARRRP